MMGECPLATPALARAYALEEILVSDGELRAQILGSLAQSPWAAGDAARKAWLIAELGLPLRDRAKADPSR